MKKLVFVGLTVSIISSIGLAESNLRAQIICGKGKNINSFKQGTLIEEKDINTLSARTELNNQLDQIEKVASVSRKKVF